MLPEASWGPLKLPRVIGHRPLRVRFPKRHQVSLRNLEYFDSNPDKTDGGGLTLITLITFITIINLITLITLTLIIQMTLTLITLRITLITLITPKALFSLAYEFAMLTCKTLLIGID